MKKGIVLLVVMTVVFAIPVFARGDQEAGDDKITIGYSLPTQHTERWVRDREFVIRAAEARGMEVLVQIANEDVAAQNSQVENLIAQGVDVLMIAPHDGESAATAVAAANAAGIPVFSYVRMILNADLDAHVADDFFQTGVLQGQFLADVQPTGNYVLLRGMKEDFNSTLFYDGAMTVLRPLIESGQINVVMDQEIIQWKEENALRIVENALTVSNNNVDAVLSPADSAAGAVVEALAAQGLDGKVWVTGGDATLEAARRIVAGTQQMTVYRDIEAMAETAVELAFRLATGTPIDDLIGTTLDNGFEDVPTVLGEATMVTKDNIDEILIESGYHSRAAVYE